MNEEAIVKKGNNSNLEKEKPKVHKTNEVDRNNKNNNIQSQEEKHKILY